MSDGTLVVAVKNGLQEVSELSLQASELEALEALNAVEVLYKAVREARKDFYDRLKGWIDEHGEIEFQGKRWYVGPNKKIERLVPLDDLAERVLSAVGGDLDAFCRCLSSGAFKYGELREVLGEDWQQCFTEKIERDVKTGKPKRKVKSLQVGFGK